MKKVIIVAISLALLAAILVPVTACAAESVKITSKEAILVSEDGQILFEHNSTEKRPIASMTKIMTLLCVYDAVDSGKTSLNDEVFVSDRAASMGGSQVFLDANSKYKLEDLIKSIVICSANDSCVAVAEHVSGSVENFVELMNNKAENLGLTNTHFENCTGLPAVSQFSCAKDVAKMLSQLITHPHYFTCANVWMEDFVHNSGRVTGMTNTNKLIRFYDGCDGGKTGYTNEAKHCLAATAKRGDTRVIAVVVGASDSQTRFKEVSEMFNYAFANYESKVYLDKTSKLEGVTVTGGKQKTVEVQAQGKLVGFGKKGSVNYTVEFETLNDVSAPVNKGDVIGSAKLIDSQGNVVSRVNLTAKCDVAEKTYFDYVRQIVTND